jgi:hypothetical protein
MTAEIDLDLGVSIAAALGQTAEACAGLAREMGHARRRRAELNQKLMPLDVDLQPIPLQAGAGVLDQPRLLAPPMGWTWQLDGLVAQGFTAGTVQVFLTSGYANAGQGINVFTFSGAGVFYQRHFRFIRYGQRLVFVASGITGTVAVNVTGLAYTDDIQGEVLL